MIWGMTIEPGQVFPINIQDDGVHLSMAALKVNPTLVESSTNVAEVFVHTKEAVYLLCTLVHGVIYQQSLDFTLSPREELSFSITGHGEVHITGFTREQQFSFEGDNSTFYHQQAEQSLGYGQPDFLEPNDIDPLMGENESDSLSNSEVSAYVNQWEERDRSEGNVPIQDSNTEEESGTLDKSTKINVKGECMSTQSSCLETSDENSLQQIHSMSHLPASQTINVSPAVQSPGIPGSGETGKETAVPSSATSGDGFKGSDIGTHQNSGRILNGVAVYQTEAPGSDPSDSECMVDTPTALSDRRTSRVTQSDQQGPHQPQKQNMEEPENTCKIEALNPREEPGEVVSTPNDPPTATRYHKELIRPSKIHILPATYRHRNQTLKTWQSNSHRRINSQSNIACNHCMMSFPDVQSLERHECYMAYSDGFYRCRFCSQSFSNSRNCEEHERYIHIGSKSFKCRYCEKYFKTKPTCEIHERIHTGVKPYQCKFCQKSFTQFSSCKIHERIHTGLKPFQCRFCQKSFNVRGNCTTHERIHTGHRPYTCKYCSKSFAVKSNCKTHERTHMFREMQGHPMNS